MHRVLEVVAKARGHRLEKLGRVAKVAVEHSFLGCGGRPPAQRDSGYRAGSPLSIQLFGKGAAVACTPALIRAASALKQNKGVGADAELSV